MIGRASTHGLAKEIPIRLIYSTNRLLHIPRGTAVAECSVIPKYPEIPRYSESPSSTDLQFRSTFVEQDEIPANFPKVLKPLVQNMSVDNPGKRKRIISILDEYREAFSLNGELGFTNRFLHRINTGDDTPIKQQPRRLPLFTAGEADQCMDEMKKAGVIVPCDGEDTEWASPIVLMKNPVGLQDFVLIFAD